MSRTERTDYRGRPRRDGQWARRCPDPWCSACQPGPLKRARRHRARAAAGADLR